jgi:L,D-transpeptidase YcbB
MVQPADQTVIRLLWVMIVACVVAMVVLAGSIPAKASDISDTFSTTQNAIQNALPLPDDSKSVASRIATFYQTRDFKPVWSGDDDAQSRADLVRDALEHADEQGLAPRTYLNGISAWTDTPVAGADAADFDIAMTTALFHYALDVRLGRIKPSDVYKDVSLTPQDFDVADALAKALKSDTLSQFLQSLPPHHPGYRGLVKALALYRGIADQGGWPKVPAGISLQGNDKREDILATRLAFEDPALDAIVNPSPADVRIALLRFQRRMGLEDNGELDANTLAALNISASYRAKEIAANMERWRWLPHGFERDYIYVNVPDQSLDFVHNRVSLLHSRVVIGMKTSPTPIMRTEAEAVVVNPPWDIPDDIAAKKLLPHLRQDASYLVSRGMVLADGPSGDPHGTKIDWRHVKADNIPYQIQQNPGSDNALGVVMLDTPNDFGVYLHDTPHKELFKLSTREKSNGCIRVEEAVSLASLTLKIDPDDNQDFKDTIATGNTQRMALSTPLPVYVLYWTAMADADGVTQFRPDRYNRDAPLIARLNGDQPVKKPAAPKALAAALAP